MHCSCVMWTPTPQWYWNQEPSLMCIQQNTMDAHTMMLQPHPAFLHLDVTWTVLEIRCTHYACKTLPDRIGKNWTSPIDLRDLSDKLYLFHLFYMGRVEMQMFENSDKVIKQVANETPDKLELRDCSLDFHLLLAWWFCSTLCCKMFGLPQEASSLLLPW